MKAFSGEHNGREKDDEKDRKDKEKAQATSSAIPRKACKRSTWPISRSTRRKKTYATSASKDFHLFYVGGRDDVHDILKHVLSRVSVSLYLNMFGYDDDDLQRHHHGDRARRNNFNADHAR